MDILDRFFKNERKNVALTLSSGGARGLAHIGAIEALEQQGYKITSIAGTSCGALVAGLYAAGRLDAFKAWVENIDNKKIRELTDYTLSLSYLVKGDRIIEELKKICPDRNIEELPIPFRCVATDWKTGQEVVFDHGSMWQAIRASISVPAYFEPVELDGKILIDGGISNPFPLDRVVRTKNDLLVGVNVSGHDYGGIYERRKSSEAWMIKNSKVLSLLKKVLPEGIDPSFNYYTLLNQTISIAISQNAHKSILLNKPDMLLDLPMKRYSGSDYDKFKNIRKIGFEKMINTIEKYKSKRK